MENKKHLVHVVKFRWLWMGLSALLLIPGIIAMIYLTVTLDNHTPLKVGIDYTGGTVFQYGVDKKVDNNGLAILRENLQTKGIENPSLQIINVNDTATKSNTKDIISVRTKFVASEEVSHVSENITSVLKEEYQNAELLSTSSIGPTLGSELFKNSLIALTLACLGIVAYLTFRFQLDFALAAILATIHDVLFILGVFALLGIFMNVQIDGLFITALLTVIGFSVHDTIVVFDRIRENSRYYAKETKQTK